MKNAAISEPSFVAIYPAIFSKTAKAIFGVLGCETVETIINHI